MGFEVAHEVAFVEAARPELEKRNFLLTDPTDFFEGLMREVGNITGATEEKLRLKAESLMYKNPDYCKLKAIANILRGSRANIPGDSSPAELASFKFAPITSTDVEWTFSKLKAILTDRRHGFTFDNLKMALVVHCND